ncbi:MAG: hypothetical protein HOW73_19675 [Polyangiaceae bacterium]|nr:hypothetical protein [Polyangiaceae bacterium]
MISSAIARPLVLLLLSGLLACGDDGGGAGGEGGGATVNECKPVSGAGTEHASITESETWTADASPHIVTADLSIPEGVTLTLEPCAEVRLQEGRSIHVEGGIVGKGTSARPILVTAADAAPWSVLEVTDPGTISLAYTTVEGGGVEGTNAFAMIDTRGDQLAPAAPTLDFDNVTIRNSATYGISLRENAAFSSASRALTITGSGQAPLRILPRLATNIPDGDYTGNAIDRIVVENEVGGNIDVEDVTFPSRGVPYQIGGPETLPELVVGPSAVTLTIEAGAELLFLAGGRLTADVDGATGGSISAIGTPDLPIVFASASDAPMPGDWMGIWIEHVSSGTRFENVVIQYAGGPSFANSFHCEPDGSFSDEDAAISFFAQPTSDMLTGSVIADSPKIGVNLAYYGDPVDFLSANEFSNIGKCKVSTPRPVEGVCPMIPCP